jgi:TonB family protein
MSKLFLFCRCASLVLLLAAAASAQEVMFNYYYTFEPAMITEPPQLGGLEIAFPDAARKNGVEGKVKASGTLGEDGKVRDIVVHNDLGHGVGAAVQAGLQKWYFKPAKFEGKPAPMKFSVDYIVSMVYDESDKNVTKPKIVDKPLPPYPASQRADGLKGKVEVRVLFMSGGELKVLGVSSVMPKDFDNAAKEAAANIKFNPATHKKSKQPVSQAMTVEYDFKP